MALWLDLIPRLHRAPDLVPANFGGHDGCYDHDQLDDSTFEPHAARVSDSDCGRRKRASTVQLPVAATSFPVVTRQPTKHEDRRLTTRSYVTPRYRQ